MFVFRFVTFNNEIKQKDVIFAFFRLFKNLSKLFSSTVKSVEKRT